MHGSHHTRYKLTPNLVTGEFYGSLSETFKEKFAVKNSVKFLGEKIANERVHSLSNFEFLILFLNRVVQKVFNTSG